MRKLKLLLCCVLLLAGCEEVLFDNPSSKKTNREVYDDFFYTFGRVYANFRVRDIDWYKTVKSKYEGRVNEEMSRKALFNLCGEILVNEVKDGHVSLTGNNLFVNAGENNWSEDNTLFLDYYFNGEREIYQMQDLYGSDNLQYFTYGFIGDNHDIGYIDTHTFGGFQDGVSNKEYDGMVQEILGSFKDTKGVVIDARSQGGGSSELGGVLASPFLQEDVQVFKKNTRCGEGIFDLKPSRDKLIYKGSNGEYSRPVVVLIGSGNGSAGEHFAEGIGYGKYVTTMGDTTMGIFSGINILQMKNGWIMSIPVEEVLKMDGSSLEGVGVIPEVLITPSDMEAFNQSQTVESGVVDYPLLRAVEYIENQNN
ncbi:hypothetical protein K4L44_10095 [Halosquirtibacter laminarini]|uniref:Uncharacterized protein n=1 Tax=Halosquirtibacter laminarini TaxID=3374600 RepID=A0AC61NQT6_9BACT|nr:hypothetical protein K4L44_10095 [Prolixibacteraceae bacterium]